MAIWMVVIAAGAVAPAARWAALIYAIPYVVIPTIVRILRGGGSPAPTPASLHVALATASAAAGALGVAVHAGLLWWSTVAAGLLTAAGMHLAARRAA